MDGEKLSKIGMRRVILAAVGIVLLGVPAPASADHVDLAELYQILPWDTLHTITNPRFDDRPYVAPYEEVIGVTIGNESHTYPLKLMNYHEVINDVVGGVPIVVGYCPLCGTALVYERTVESRVLTFRTSGYLYRNNKVLFDVETASLWPLILGEGINGTYHGTKLRLATSTRLPFADWMSLHPDAKVVARPWGPVLCPSPCPVPPFFEGYNVNPYADYQAGNSTYAPIRHPDPRFHPKTYVVGVVLGGEAWAFAYPDLLAVRAINTVVGGIPILVALAVDNASTYFPVTSAHVYMRGAANQFAVTDSNELVDNQGARYSILTGIGENGMLEPVPFFYGFWFAWKDVYPGTCVYGYPCGEPLWPTWAPYAVLAATAIGILLLAAWGRRTQSGRSTRTDADRTPPLQHLARRLRGRRR